MHQLGRKYSFGSKNFRINLIRLNKANITIASNPNKIKPGVNAKFKNPNEIVATTSSGEITCMKISAGKINSP